MQDIVVPELIVMNEVAKLMKPLNKNEARRVIAWLSEYFDTKDEDTSNYEPAATEPDFSTVIGNDPEPQDVPDSDALAEDDSASEPATTSDAVDPDSFEVFYNSVAPKTVIQKAVTAAYWLETKDELCSWRSHDITKCLGSAGVKVNALSGALAIAEKKDEPLVELMSKSGDSMQARKTFRLADAGRDWVEGRIG